MTSTRRGGFTLRELIIVIAIFIIVLLVAVLVLQREASSGRGRAGPSSPEAEAETLLAQIAAELERAEVVPAVSLETSGRRASPATVLRDQGLRQVEPPPTGALVGRSREATGSVRFGGDGAGFSYRLVRNDAGGDNEGGPACLYFEPVAQVTEAGRGADLNRDGDLADAFDLGRLRRRSWSDAGREASTTDVALGAPSILQESGAWGADLDADGFEDPIVLLDSETGLLRIRLFLLVGDPDRPGAPPDVRRVETALHVHGGREE